MATENDTGSWRKISEFVQFLGRAGPRLGPLFVVLTLRALLLLAFAWVAYIHIEVSSAQLTFDEVEVCVSVLGALAVIVAAPVDLAVSIMKFDRALKNLWRAFLRERGKKLGPKLRGSAKSTKAFASVPKAKSVKPTRSASTKKPNAGAKPLPRRAAGAV